MLSRLNNTTRECIDIVAIPINRSGLLQLTQEMIDNGEIKTSMEFAEKFMFSFDDKNKFPMNIDLLVEYKIYDRKDNAKTKLLKHFTVGADFQVTKSSSCGFRTENIILKTSSHNSEIIMLTVDCFKEMCIYSNNDIGKQVRRYYLDIEKVFKRYINLEFINRNNKISLLERENKKLAKLHNSNILRHKFYKFNRTGPCFYIIINAVEYANGFTQIKIGVAGISRRKSKYCVNCKDQLDDENEYLGIDERLKNHRTLWTRLQVKFLVFTEKAKLLESCMKTEYENKINPSGFEMIENIQLEKVINSAKRQLDIFNENNSEPNYEIEENLDIYNNIALSQLKIEMKELVSENMESIKEIIQETVQKSIQKTIENTVQSTTETKIEKIIQTKLENINNDNDNYTDKKLKEILGNFGLLTKGLKDEKIKRLKEFLLEKIEDKEDIDHNSDEENDSDEIKSQIFEQNENKETKDDENNEESVGTSLNIFMRDDGYIYVTKFAQTFNKRSSDWTRLNETKALIRRLERELHIPASQLIDVRKGNSSKYSQGTWMHPNLAIDFVQWCSPNLKLQISKLYHEHILTNIAKHDNVEIPL